jgi:hypothetical protein
MQAKAANENTKEQQQRLADENARQRQVSFRWMASHLHDFTPSVEAARLMAEYINDRRLPWTHDVLEEAFKHLVEDGSISYTPPTDEPEPVAQQAPAPDRLAWGFVLTREAVRALSARELKKHLQSKKYGKEFERALNGLRLTRGEIR